MSDLDIEQAASELVKKMPGNRHRLWTWRNGASNFTLMAAKIARERAGLPSGEGALLSLYQRSTVYVLAAEECLRQIEVIRQARDGKIRG